MRVVPDTNIIISGLYSKRGASYNTKHFPKVVTRLYGVQPVTPRKFLKFWRDKP